tara:strand:+ start:94 stop:756 length:663 start_codon:yes stop_codon:yes gene_type:complete
MQNYLQYLRIYTSLPTKQEILPMGNSNFLRSIKKKVPRKDEIKNLIKKQKKYLEENVINIENNNKLTKVEKSKKIIFLFASVCAGIATQPIPFPDLVVLTPIQILMTERLAAIWGLKGKVSKKEIAFDIAKVSGLGLVAQSLITNTYRIFIPYLGALTTIPMVFGLTYGIGNVMSEQFKRKSKGLASMTDEEMKEMFKKFKKKGEKEYKKGDEINIEKTF